MDHVIGVAKPALVQFIGPVPFFVFICLISYVYWLLVDEG